MIKVWQGGVIFMGCFFPCVCFAQNSPAIQNEKPLPRYSTGVLLNLRGLSLDSDYPNLTKEIKPGQTFLNQNRTEVLSLADPKSKNISVPPVNASTAESLPHDATGSIPPSANRIVREAPNSCDVSRSSLCYDYRTGRPIYKPARDWMPEIYGLKAENMSLSRSRLSLTYSFN